MNGPQWQRLLAILITYDDCGCFDHHVLATRGTPRDPGADGDHQPVGEASVHRLSTWASPASFLSFTEWVLDVPPLNEEDANAYNYSESFDFTQEPIAPIDMVQTPISDEYLRYLEEHPPPPDDT